MWTNQLRTSEQLLISRAVPHSDKPVLTERLCQEQLIIKQATMLFNLVLLLPIHTILLLLVNVYSYFP